jgi:hypothetical protein
MSTAHDDTTQTTPTLARARLQLRVMTPRTDVGTPVY